MEWKEWVEMAAAARAAQRRRGGRSIVRGISVASIWRYERGNCSRREQLELWAAALDMDMDVAVAAWRSQYEPETP